MCFCGGNTMTSTGRWRWLSECLLEQNSPESTLQGKGITFFWEAGWQIRTTPIGISRNTIEIEKQKIQGLLFMYHLFIVRWKTNKQTTQIIRWCKASLLSSVVAVRVQKEVKATFSGCNQLKFTNKIQNAQVPPLLLKKGIHVSRTFWYPKMTKSCTALLLVHFFS